ncbi:MAG: pyruvate formate lyase family protein, partial [Promethearchaeota archaeon]
MQKEELLNADLWLCMERAKFYTESYKETENEPPPLRVAKAIKHTFENMTVRISPHELLVGNRSSHLIAPPFAAERGDFSFLFKYRLPELKKFGYHISKEHQHLLFKEIIPYWKGKTVRELKVEQFIEHGLNSQLNFSRKEFSTKMKAFGLSSIIGMLLSKGNKFKQILTLLFNLRRYLGALKAGTQDNVIGRGRCIDTQAHIVVGHKNVLTRGFGGIWARAAKRLAAATDSEEISFLESVKLACEAIRDFSHRFSKLALDMADTCPEPARKEELLKISKTCETVPWNPPESFHEALQSMWFTQNAIIITYGAGSGITPGRVDQLLYPFYKRDVDGGKITRQEALELLEEFIIKINNNVVIWPNIAGTNLNHLGSDVENITIGGLDPAGNDATNELSYLFIEAIKNTKLATTVSFRFSKKSPEKYINEVIELHRYTSGPALFNDDVNVKTMVNDGYPVEAARDYCLVGCVEPSGNGDTFGATGGTKIYLPSVLDLVLNRGKTTFFG